ncbi:unnamed protein product [Discosporangium mesarthrocarpum]
MADHALPNTDRGGGMSEAIKQGHQVQTTHVPTGESKTAEGNSRVAFAPDGDVTSDISGAPAASRKGASGNSSRRVGGGSSRSGRGKGYAGDVNAHLAAYEGDMEKLRRYVAAGGDLEKRDSYEATPLLLAAEKGHDECVEFLLEKGADIRARDEHQYTALHLAAYYGRVGVVSILLRCGADITVVDDRGRVPKRLASKKMISNLLAAKETEHKLGVDIIEAVEKNDINSVRSFISAKGDLNCQGKNQMTPLHIASFNGLTEIVRLLLEGGADPNSVDEDRDTPLHYACSSGAAEIISLLLAKGADPSATDGLGRTPMERSTRADIQEVLEVESYKSVPKNIAQIRRTTENLQSRVDANESLFVQKAIAIKGLRIALEEKDNEIRRLKLKVLKQDADLKAMKAKMVAIEDIIKQAAEASQRGRKEVEQVLKDLIDKNTSKDGRCRIS